MTPGGSAWLDRTARRLAGDAGDGRHELRSTEPTLSDARSASEEQLSRASAVKLGVATSVSLMFGLWRASEARALDRDECIGNCYDRVLNEAANATNYCRSYYGDRLWKSRPKTWGRVREAVDLGGWGLMKKITQQAMKDLCESQVAKKAIKDFDKCDDACKIACAKALRSAQGISSGRQVCKPPPPPKPYTPPPPPPPNMTADPCWACAQVGGQCCGPFTAGADGTLVPCACANPTVGCERYGCGG